MSDWVSSGRLTLYCVPENNGKVCHQIPLAVLSGLRSLLISICILRGVAGPVKTKTERLICFKANSEDCLEGDRPSDS
jgi:hypothetical protein